MRRAVRTVIALAAAGMIVVDRMFLGLELLKQRTGGGAPGIGRCIAFSILTLAGLVLMWKSSAIAKRLTEDYDE